MAEVGDDWTQLTIRFSYQGGGLVSEDELYYSYVVLRIPAGGFGVHPITSGSAEAEYFARLDDAISYLKGRHIGYSIEARQI